MNIEIEKKLSEWENRNPLPEKPPMPTLDGVKQEDEEKRTSKKRKSVENKTKSKQPKSKTAKKTPPFASARKEAAITSNKNTNAHNSNDLSDDSDDLD